MPLSISPIAMRLYVTKRCRMHCSYCPDGGIPRYSPHVEDASYAEVRGLIDECPGLGIRFIELAGGDPLLWSGLTKTLSYCLNKDVFILLPVSGEGLICSLKESTDRNWLSLPGLLRVSVHYNPKRRVSFEAIRSVLEVVRKYRPKGEIQLGVILIPGRDGNISKEQLLPVLDLAREFLCPINLAPVIGTWLNGFRDLYEGLWANISEAEKAVLGWLVRRPEVLPASPEKIDHRLSGGNNTNHPLCQAGRTVATIRYNRVIDPCVINPCWCADIKHGLMTTIASRNYLRGEGPGRFDYCDGCTFGCSDVRGTLLKTNSARLHEAYISM